MITDLTLRHFRCFETLACEFAPGMNVLIGANAQGKTSLLEAVCVLARLQSPRTSRLGEALQHGRRGFVVDGRVAGRHMQFYYAPERRKLALDGVVQTGTADFLAVARVVWFGNADIDMVRGGAELRRRYLDFAGAQVNAGYRQTQRAYERALRSRNHLLKAPRPSWREIAAFDAPLIEHGAALTEMRAALLRELEPHAAAGQRAMSGKEEDLRLEYARGAGEDFAKALADGRETDARLRQTGSGPHRDDILLLLNGRGAQYASEGQQRSMAVALKLGQAGLLEARHGTAPLLLMDDIFGELDIARRNALLGHLPAAAQQLITTTHLDWLSGIKPGRVQRVDRGRVVSLWDGEAEVT
ncbi:MAG TPA: DNA replication and repair protein RecF [Chthoniobacteraceae bacterium]|nr:DNA replication and repair protein RecF [Chthoniobacteraceae bacterium]